MRIDETFDADGRLREAIAYDDHAGPGTGTRTTYDEHGNETSVEKLDDLPIVEPEPVIVEPTAPLDAFAAKLRAELPAATTLTKVRAVLSDALDELG